MSWERDLLRRYGQATEPVEPASARVVRRLLSADADPQVRALLRGLPEPAPGAVERVRRRLAPRPRPALTWLVPVGALAVAALAVAIVLTNPEDPQEPMAQAARDVALESPAAWAAAIASDHVAMTYQGSGSVHTEAQTHRIDWVRGTLDIEVVPDQGEVVEVVTREATVRVVGTAFRVHKDLLGTRVEVTRGQVQVVCGAQAPATLTRGGTLDCLPVDAAGMLGRITQLDDDGVAPSALLTEVERGLSLDPNPSEVQVLTEDWRDPLLHGLVSDALAVQDCVTALPHLQALEDLQRANDDELGWLRHCEKL